MRYWDASALAPLLVQERGTDLARGWLADDPGVVTWAWTRVELTGAIERRVREGGHTRGRRRKLLDRLDELAATWHEVTDVLAVRVRALSVLARHPLRAADAAQVGAALLVAEDDPTRLGFVCLDQRLAEAAEREGLRTLGWPEEG